MRAFLQRRLINTTISTKRIFINVFLLVFSSFFIVYPIMADELNIGDKAPAFDLKDQNSQNHSLESYPGKWVVIYFYPKDNTPGCTKEACNFRDDIELLTRQDSQVIGISVDSVNSHKKFSDKYHLPFPILSDGNGNTAAKYDSLIKLGPIKIASRHTFIVAPDGNIAKIYRSVDVGKHSREIIDDLKRLQGDLD